MKRSLGIGYFTNEYFANNLEDITWKQYTTQISTDDKSVVLSMAERQVIEEKV